jgi:hypothetical protein
VGETLLKKKVRHKLRRGDKDKDKIEAAGVS